MTSLQRICSRFCTPPSAHLLTRHKACFHPSCANARLCFHSRPQARFHSFAPSHTPQGVFSFFMRKRTFALSLAPSGAFSLVFAPRGAAACSIQNPHQRVTASSPEYSRLGGETLGESNKSIQNPERSEWVAEAGASRFPMNGGAGFPWVYQENEILPPLTRHKACFHPSYTNARLRFHSRPLAHFHLFLPHATQPRALF